MWFKFRSCPATPVSLCEASFLSVFKEARLECGLCFRDADATFGDGIAISTLSGVPGLVTPPGGSLLLSIMSSELSVDSTHNEDLLNFLIDALGLDTHFDHSLPGSDQIFPLDDTFLENLVR